MNYGDKIIQLQEGIQQGDPLGPLLFCLSVQPLLQSMHSELVIGYMDDFTLGGPGNAVAADVDRLSSLCPTLGLSLNTSKCELISSQPLESMNGTINEFIRLKPEQASLLGSPLLVGSAMDDLLESKLQVMNQALNRLNLISSHDALTLLKASCSSSKLIYHLRSAPCVNHPSLSRFDFLQRSALSQITNVLLCDRNWTQATLPVKNGGLGIRCAVDLAPAAFLSSASSTLAIQQALLRLCSASPPDNHFIRVQAEWLTSNSPAPLPPTSIAHKQSAWDEPLITRVVERLVSSADNDLDKARILAASSPHSGEWLHALPISSCGLRLDNNSVRVAVAMRLGARVCEPHSCPCGKGIDSSGSHALSCKSNPGRTMRHNYINDIIARALSRAEIPASKEPSGLFRTDGKRPDGITQIPWSSGKSAVWDVTIVDTLAQSYIHHTANSARSAAEIAVSRKEDKYRELDSNYLFFPLAFESLGPIAAKSVAFLKEIGRRSSVITEDRRETSFLIQRISTALQRFNALMVQNSFPDFPPPDDP